MRDAASGGSQLKLNVKGMVSVVDYGYDYGDATSAKFKWGKPAFVPGNVGMFVDTGRPPGRLLGG